MLCYPACGGLGIPEEVHVTRASENQPNQALERNVYARHASCGARVTPAIAVAHL